MKKLQRSKTRIQSPVRTFLILAALCLCAGDSQAAETVDRILVTVNDEIVTSRDLQASVEPVLAQYRATLSGSEFEDKKKEAERIILEKLVDDRLIQSAAKREKIEVKEDEIDEMMKEVKGQFPSEEAFERILRQQGVSFRQLREKLKNQILNRRLVDQKVRAQVTISPGEVKEYYDKHPNEFMGAQKVKLRHILIRSGTERSLEEAKEIVRSLIDKMWGGENMAELAKKYSEASEAASGGDMSWVEKGQLVDYIDSAIFKLSAGEHTEPIQSQLGIHIFKVEAVKEPELRPFEQVRKRIEGFIYRKKVADKMDEWLKVLRKDAYIVYQS